jgi:RHS repeat-associated protein
MGAQVDRLSGLLYANGRYYDPATGRYLTPNRDFDPYRPGTLNPYAPT